MQYAVGLSNFVAYKKSAKPHRMFPGTLVSSWVWPSLNPYGEYSLDLIELSGGKKLS